MALKSVVGLEHISTEILTDILEFAYFSENVAWYKNSQKDLPTYRNRLFKNNYSNSDNRQDFNFSLRPSRLLLISRSINRIVVSIHWRHWDHDITLPYFDDSPVARQVRLNLQEYCRSFKLSKNLKDNAMVAMFLRSCTQLQSVEANGRTYCMRDVASREPDVLHKESLKRPPLFTDARIISIGNQDYGWGGFRKGSQCFLNAAHRIAKLKMTYNGGNSVRDSTSINLPSLRELYIETHRLDLHWGSLSAEKRFILTGLNLEQVTIVALQPENWLLSLQWQNISCLKKLSIMTAVTGSRRLIEDRWEQYPICDASTTASAFKTLEMAHGLQSITICCPLPSFPIPWILQNRDLRSLQLQDVGADYWQKFVILVLTDSSYINKHDYVESFKALVTDNKPYPAVSVADLQAIKQSFPYLGHLDIGIDQAAADFQERLNVIAAIPHLKSLTLRTQTTGNELDDITTDTGLRDAQHIWDFFRSQPRPNKLQKLVVHVLQTVLITARGINLEEMVQLHHDLKFGPGRGFKQRITPERVYYFHWSRNGPLEPFYGLHDQMGNKGDYLMCDQDGVGICWAES